MHRQFLLTGALVASIIFTGTLADAGAADYKRCKNVYIRQNGQIIQRTHGLFQKRSSCRVARKVARAYLSTEAYEGAFRPYGYKCSGGLDGVACHKGSRRITWGSYYD